MFANHNPPGRLDESGFASNNPFRRRASQSTPFSPDSLSPTNPGPLASSKPPRPQSRNPFLDVFDDKDDDYDISNNRPRSATHKYSFDSSIDQKPQFTGNTLDLFVSLNPFPPANSLVPYLCDTFGRFFSWSEKPDI